MIKKGKTNKKPKKNIIETINVSSINSPLGKKNKDK